MNLRIHHFFDIIRDYGRGKEFHQHQYGHSYHKVAELIRKDPKIKINIVIAADDVCEGCLYLREGKCLDKIDHRKDFSSKQEFNDNIDNKIMTACLIENGDTLNPTELCKIAKLYLKNIKSIYDGNDIEDIKNRKLNVIKGLKYYSKEHGVT